MSPRFPKTSIFNNSQKKSVRKKSEQLIEEESNEGLTTKKVSNHSRNLNFNHIFTDKV